MWPSSGHISSSIYSNKFEAADISLIPSIPLLMLTCFSLEVLNSSLQATSMHYIIQLHYLSSLALKPFQNCLCTVPEYFTILQFPHFLSNMIFASRAARSSNFRRPASGYSPFCWSATHFFSTSLTQGRSVTKLAATGEPRIRRFPGCLAPLFQSES